MMFELLSFSCLVGASKVIHILHMVYISGMISSAACLILSTSSSKSAGFLCDKSPSKPPKEIFHWHKLKWPGWSFDRFSLINPASRIILAQEVRNGIELCTRYGVNTCCWNQVKLNCYWPVIFFIACIIVPFNTLRYCSLWGVVPISIDYKRVSINNVFIYNFTNNDP